VFVLHWLQYLEHKHPRDRLCWLDLIHIILLELQNPDFWAILSIRSKHNLIVMVARPVCVAEPAAEYGARTFSEAIQEIYRNYPILLVHVRCIA
jgi:hypothetical protein